MRWRQSRSRRCLRDGVSTDCSRELPTPNRLELVQLPTHVPDERRLLQEGSEQGAPELITLCGQVQAVFDKQFLARLLVPAEHHPVHVEKRQAVVVFAE